MLHTNEALPIRNGLNINPGILAAVLVMFGIGGFAQAAPSLEQAPSLSTEDYGVEQFPNEGAIAVPVGEAGFYPSGAVRITSIDNLYYQDGDEQKATRLQVLPKLDLVAEGSKSVFWGLLRGDFRSHSGESGADGVDSSSNADTSDFRLRGFGHIDIDNRQRLDVEVSHSRLSDEIGTGRTRSIISSADDLEDLDESDTYHLNRVGLTYSYGNPRSRGELVAGLAVGTLKYVENEDVLAVLNRDMNIIWGRFSYKLTGKTTLYSRLGHRIYKYTDDDNSKNNRRDRDATSLTLGANWNSTGLWYGSAYVSFSDWDYGERETADGVTTDGGDTTLGANLYWEIRSYSIASIYVRQFVDDVTTGGSDDTRKTSTIGVNWRHGWTERLSTTVAGYTSSDESEGVTSNERQVMTLEGRVSVRRWLNVLLGASIDQLDSEGIDASRNLVYIGLEGNL